MALAPNGSLPAAKFTLRPSLVLSYIGSITARHSSSGRQPNCGVEQTAPPIFGRATITLGIGPRSSFTLISDVFLSYARVDLLFLSLQGLGCVRV